MRSRRSRRWTGRRRCCRCSPGFPEHRTHDYVRHGTTTLFAALEIATGKVTAAIKPRHRHQEFLAFLKQVARAHPDRELHLVMDNYAAHKRVEIHDWLAANPRIHGPLHPDLRILAEPGRGLVRDHRTPSHPARHLPLGDRPQHQDPRLHQRLERRAAHPFVWTKTADDILKKANRSTTSNSGH